MSDTDFVRLKLDVGTKTIPCHKLGFNWPPPEYIHMTNGSGILGLSEAEYAETPKSEQPFILRRTSHSQITDSQIEKMEHVARGAEYEYIGKRP